MQFVQYLNVVKIFLFQYLSLNSIFNKNSSPK